MQYDSPEGLLDINQIADAVGLPRDATRAMLDLCDLRPAAKYKTRDLWFRNALDALLEERAV